MSILSGFFKTKKYRKTDTGYQLQSEWTSASTVEMADGNTAETNLGAIQGITDSLTATSSNIALSAKAGNNLQGQIDDVTSNLNRNTFGSATEILNQQTFVAPKDGYVIISANGGYVECRINGVVMLSTHKANYAQTMSLFVRKGMTLGCYSEDATNTKMEFIPLI